MPRGFSARREKRDIDAEILKGIVGQLADGVGFAHEGELFTRASCGSKEEILRDGKFALLEHLKELPADHSGGADNGNAILFHN